MGALLSVVLPVFLVLGFGYAAVWRGLIGDEAVAGLMTFAQGFAIPCLLFRAISTLDLGQSFDLRLLASFYIGALAGFGLGIAGARLLFGRPWEDAIAIGFIGLFSNSLLLGLPITERAYGTAALEANYVIVALHAPFCYAVGITVMEVVRARGEPLARLPGRIAGTIFRNALVIGILLGFLVNLGGIPLPGALVDALDLMIRAALPAALFGLGGILYRYRPEGDMRTILYIVAVSVLAHPALTYGLGRGFGLSVAELRSATVTAAMAPGVNAYLFANIYGVAKRVAASSVLIGTAVSVLTTAFWLTVLP